LFSLNYDGKSTAELQRHESFVPWQAAAALQLDQKSATIGIGFGVMMPVTTRLGFFVVQTLQQMRRG
jgi:hypothetical protein